MIIDSHVHIWGYPVLNEIGDKIRTTEDLIGFRTRYPELYDRTLTEDPIDNSDALIAHMDEAGIDRALIQVQPGSVTNDQVAISVRRHPDRLYGLMRIGHAQEAAYEYVEDPAPIRAAAEAEIDHCIDDLGMRGLGEIFVRALTAETDPEAIARGLSPMMDAVRKHGVPVQFPTAWSQFPGGLLYGNLIWADEVACRYPDVPIILTKMGRSMATYFEPSWRSHAQRQYPFRRGRHVRGTSAPGARRDRLGTDFIRHRLVGHLALRARPDGPLRAAPQGAGRRPGHRRRTRKHPVAQRGPPVQAGGLAN